MALAPRLLRRVIIVATFLAVFFLLGYGTRQLTQPTPTCTDGVKNGEEEGVDCGLFACQNYCEPDLDPPKVVSAKLIKAGDKDYDFVAKITNTNQEFGASEVVYELVLFNGSDEAIFKREGIFYILPGQTKYLILSALTTERNVTRAEIDIKSARWQKLESLEGMNFLVRRETHVKSGDSSHLQAVVLNDSDFDFQIVDIDILLLNSDKEIIAVYRTDVRKLLARTERHFVATWPFVIDGRVDKIEINVATNLFSDLNYLKSYGSDVEKFQTY